MTAVSVPNRDGELLDQLDAQPAEVLADALDALRDHIAREQAAVGELEAELRRRLKLRKARLAVWGDWEVESEIRRESVWDADALEPAMAALVDDGTVTAADVADVIHREPVVSRSHAKRLLARLDGDARASVAACLTWREKPGPLRVVRSVQLPTGDEIRALRDDGQPGAPSGADTPSDTQAPPAADLTLTAQELFA